MSRVAMALRRYLDPFATPQAELARRLGCSPQMISDLLHGRRRLSPQMAMRLELVTGTNAERWLLAQAEDELAELRRREAEGRKP